MSFLLNGEYIYVCEDWMNFMHMHDEYLPPVVYDASELAWKEGDYIGWKWKDSKG